MSGGAGGDPPSGGGGALGAARLRGPDGDAAAPNGRRRIAGAHLAAAPERDDADGYVPVNPEHDRADDHASTRPARSDDRAGTPPSDGAALPDAARASSRWRDWLALPLHLVWFVLATAIYLARARLGWLGLRGADRRRAQGEWLRRYLVAMGPLYVKLGQILSTRSDLLPREVIDRLRLLQDDVPPMSARQLRQALTTTYRRPVEELFASFERTPIASASIAQVHRAQLWSGVPVAVKIVKHGVARSLQRNLTLVTLILRLVHFARPSLRHLNLPRRFAEIRVLLEAQTDMRQEAANQAALAASFDRHPYVRIPRLHGALCSGSVIVMDFVDAIPGKEVGRVRLPPAQLARRLQDAIFTMLYLNGLCHADPHPGNLFFTEEGGIILIDFGIVAILNEDEKWALASFYYACTRHEWRLAVERLSASFILDRGRIDEAWDAFVSDAIAVLRRHYERQDRWSTHEFFRDCGDVLLRYGATYTTSFTKVELIFVSCEGTASQIDPEIDIWANARRFNDRFSPYMSPTVKATFDRHFGEQIPRSMQWRERAHRSLVAPTHLDRYFLPSAYPLFAARASGARIEDVDGNSYIDLSSGYGPHILGYAHPAVTSAIERMLRTGWVNALGNLPEVELAELIVDAFPAGELVVFSNSGTEAVIQAIRMCRTRRGRDKVAKFEGHYHGFTDMGMVSSWIRYTGPPQEPRPIAGSRGCHDGTVQDTVVLPYGDAAALEILAARADELACIILEPMPSVIADYDAPFLAKLRRVCTRLELPLVFDEVVSGFRATYGGVQVLAGVEPDLTCLGKIIGGGLPCGAVVGREWLLDLVRTTRDPFLDYESRAFVGGTMSGNSIVCAAGVAALTYLKEHPEIYATLDAHTLELSQRMRASAARHGVPFQLRARHSIFGMTFSYSQPRNVRDRHATNVKANLGLAYYMRQHGVYMPELHTILLNAAHTREDIEIVADAFDRSLVAMLEDGFFVV